VEQLVERGRRNLALIIEKNRASQPKIQSYFEAAAEEHPDVQYNVYTGVDPCVGADEVVTRILKERPETDGVLCVQDRLAIEVMYAFMEQGKRVPEDISIIGEGNSELCEVSRPRLTSLDTMVTVSTMMSVRILVDVMEGRAQTHKITLDMELVKRQSL
jgi:DNA-binding LacI/PurR family transcriptional regulator